MSSERTAEMFQNKSEEEIINWMIQNMTPEQIKSCFEGDILDVPSAPTVSTPDKPNVNNLRKYCENKRYVIHKIEKDNVFFWYYDYDSEIWKYYIKPLSDFPTSMGEKAEECGSDTVVKSNFENELKTAYNKDNIYPGEIFSEYNKDESEKDVFNEVKSEYNKEGINNSWKIEEVTNTLLTAINIQRSVTVPDEYKVLFDYAPVLIEGITGTNVFYYYLKNNGGDLEFVYDNIELEDFEYDLEKIIKILKLIILPANVPRVDGGRRVDEWKKEIKDAINNIEDSDDINRIQTIYNEFPLSNESKYFMKDIFSNNQFGKSNIDLSNYVMNKFGSNTAKLFKAKYISNKFGTNTIALVPK